MKIRVTVSTNKIGSQCETTIEIDDEDVADLDNNDREEYIEGFAKNAMFEMISWDWEIED